MVTVGAIGRPCYNFTNREAGSHNMHRMIICHVLFARTPSRPLIRDRGMSPDTRGLPSCCT